MKFLNAKTTAILIMYLLIISHRLIVFISVVDPDPNLIRIQELCGSEYGSTQVK